MAHDAEPADAALPFHVQENRRYWDATADDWVGGGERAWARDDPWGIWGVPGGRSRAAAGRHARPRRRRAGLRHGLRVGLDGPPGRDASRPSTTPPSSWPPPRRLAAEHGIDITLRPRQCRDRPPPRRLVRLRHQRVRSRHLVPPRGVAAGGPPAAAARRSAGVPGQPPDGHGLCPARRGQRRRSSGAAPTSGCTPSTGAEVEIDPGGINFAIPLSDWFALFRRIGFAIEDLREPRGPATAEGTEFFVDAAWAKRWPCELVWKLRKA